MAGLALLMALVGALIILATLRSTMHERRREFAVLRCLGASRSVVTGAILWQSLLIALCVRLVPGWSNGFIARAFFAD